MQDGRDRPQVEDLLGGELGQRLHGLARVPALAGVGVVLDDQAAVVLHATHQLLELEADEAAVGAEPR